MSKHKNNIVILPNQMRLIIIILFGVMGLVATVFTILHLALIITGRAQVGTFVLNIVLISCFIVPYRIIRHCGRDTENRYFISATECRKTALLSIVLSFIAIFRPLTPVVGKIGAIMMIIWCFCWYLCTGEIEKHTIEKYIKVSRIGINVVFAFACFLYFMIAMSTAANFSNLPSDIPSFIMIGVSAVIDIAFPYFIARRALRSISRLSVLKDT